MRSGGVRCGIRRLCGERMTRCAEAGFLRARLKAAGHGHPTPSEFPSAECPVPSASVSGLHPLAPPLPYHHRMNPTRNDLPAKTRKAMVELLNGSLADAMDLFSQAKQAHWNVKGPSFIALHELFDKVSQQVEEFADDLAERAVALGGRADGTVRNAAKASSLDEFPHKIDVQSEFVDALADRLSAFGKGVRAAIDTASEAKDQGTADLYTGISRETDKLLWFVESHTKK